MPTKSRTTTTPTQAPDLAAIAAEAAAADADLAAQESALRQNLAAIAERRDNARKARALLTAQTQTEQRAQAEQAAQAERATVESAFDADRRTLAALLAKIQDQTRDLCASIKEAAATESRLYNAALTMGRSKPDARAHRGLIEGFVYRALAQAGLTRSPSVRHGYGDRIPNRYGTPESDGGGQ